jgi:hypothetical protein
MADLTTVGARYLARAAVNAGGTTFFNNANARVGAGNSSTAKTNADTNLLGGSQAWVAMDSSYPTESNGVVVFRGTFGTSVGNYTWNEIGVANAADGGVSGTLLLRKVSSLGTKTAGETWVLEITATFSA